MTPLDTAAVDKLKVKGAGKLAALVLLDGGKFERAYLAAMVKGHTEALNLIDSQLIKSSKNDTLKEHLTETRTHITAHLEKAKQLQGNKKR